MQRAHALQALVSLSKELNELRGGSVDRVAYPCDHLAFYRDYIAPNKPCIITGATEAWPAFTKWNKSYLARALGDAQVTVAVTPNGRADAVTDVSASASYLASLGSDGSADSVASEPCLPEASPLGSTGSGKPTRCFALPAESQMTMQAFLDALSSRIDTAQQPQPEGATSNVLYLSKQNSSLTAEFKPLLGDIDADLSWAFVLFGCCPDAVNLWVGGAESVTSFHKDHYENLYAVISGEKTFTLLPPTDFYRLYLQKYPVAQYTATAGVGFDAVSAQLDLELQQETPPVRWSPVDPNPEDWDEAARLFPLFFDESLPPPLRVQLKRGELLYLPALWHHHVEQVPDEEGKCVAVNWWFDMRFDQNYAFLQFAEKCAGTDAGEPLVSQ